MDEVPSAEVGRRVREEREKAGLSLQQLSEASGVTKAYLVRLETRESNPSLAILHRISQALGLTIADLLGTPRAAYLADPDDVPSSLKAFADDAGLTSAETMRLSSIRWREGEQPTSVDRWRFIHDSLRASQGFDRGDE